jgi:ATP-binding cassette, subfamily B, bacterial
LKIRLSRFTPYARRERPRIAVLLVLALCAVAIEALLPWPLKLIVDHVVTGEPLPSAVAWIETLPGGDSASGLLAWLSAGVLLLFLAVRVVQLCKGIVAAGVTGRMKYALGADIFERLQALSLTYHHRSRAGDLVHRVTDDTECLPTLINGAVLPTITSVVMLIILFGIMWQLDAQLALIALLVALPMGLLMRVFGSRMTARAYEQQQSEGAMWSMAEQTLVSLPLVQAFGREGHEIRRFHNVAGRTIDAYLRNLVAELQFKYGIDGSQAFGVALIMLLGGLQVHHGTMTLGTLLVFLSYLASLYAPLSTLAYTSATLASAAAGARRISQVLDADEVLEEPAKPQSFTVDGSSARGHLTFEHVVFGYEPGRPVLRGVNLEIEAGETVALVGATGAGKSTLISLIPRLFDPWEGRVSIDGLDVRDAAIADVRAQVSMVLQEPFLMPVSVSENIAYGRPDASRADIVAAALAANAHEFIRRLPNGYDTVLGERGVTLSGGQRQRIAIARALLKNAPILILDEPTSALDAQTERLVVEALRRLMEDRTTIIIAHRMSTIRRADRIVVLEDGTLADSGRYERLVARSAVH